MPTIHASACPLEGCLSHSYLQELLIDNSINNIKDVKNVSEVNSTKSDLSGIPGDIGKDPPTVAISCELPLGNLSIGNVIEEHLLGRYWCCGNDCFEKFLSQDQGGTDYWQTQLDIVTMKPMRNFEFSICDKVLKPLELIHIAYLLASTDDTSALSPKSTTKDSSLHSVSQKKLLQKLDQYNLMCSRGIRKGATLEVKEVGPNMNESVRLEAIIRHILLFYPNEAFDAILTLSDVQLSDPHHNLLEFDSDYRRETRSISNIGSFMNLCVSVIHAFSLSEICSNCVRCNCQGSHNSINPPSSASVQPNCYTSAVQNSMLKILLSAGEIVNTAQCLLQWGRMKDLSLYCELVWESVHFILGEHKKYEEYYSHSHAATLQPTSTQIPVKSRRPLPHFENISDADFLDKASEAIASDQVEFFLPSPTSGRSARPNRSSGDEENHTARIKLLPPNSSSHLRVRLMEASLVQQIVDQILQ